MDITEVMKYILPSLAVLAASYLTIRQFLMKDETRLRLDLATGNNKILTPMRMAAYERIILFLERLKPESMVSRVLQPQMTVHQFHIGCLSTVRAEYEHNLSQQIYISEEAWESVVTAKESVLKLINTASEHFDAEQKASDMATAMIKMMSAVDDSPVDDAIEKVKEEISEIFKY